MSKKSFKPSAEEVKSNPALSYFTEPEQEAESTRPIKEIKSRRYNLLIRPSLLKDLKKIATMKRTSVNDLINTTLEAYTGQETAAIEKYNITFTEDN